MGFKRLEEHSRELQAVTREKEHTNEMLLADKAYLAKQVRVPLTHTHKRPPIHVHGSRSRPSAATFTLGPFCVCVCVRWIC